MNRRLLAVLIVGCAFVAAVAALIVMTRPQPAPAAPPAEEAAAPRPRPAPPRPAPPPEPAREPAPRVARRAAPAPKPAPAPAAPAPDAGTLHIDSDVPGSQVFIDRVYLGTAPVTARDVKPGEHRLNVSAPGYEGLAETIDVAPGPRDVKVRFKEVHLDAAIDVIHKHRFGSCRGRLIATPQGLEYRTSDHNDAFTSGLLELQAFEVDYLQKNLRVKLQNGKTYNFTDPDGNADHLFVFHRDVEKARERLQKGDRPAAR